MASRRFKVALVLGGVCGVVVSTFGPLVRYEAAKVAARYGGVVAIEHVVPTWRGVALRGVDVALEEVPSATIHVNEIEVSLAPGARAVTLHGGTVTAVGARDVVVRQVEVWRSHYRSTSGRQTGGSGDSTSVEVDGLDVAWRDRSQSPTEAISATGVRFDRSESGLRVNAEDARLELGPTTVAVKHGEILLVRRGDEGYRVGGLSAGAVDAEISLPASGDSGESGPRSLPAASAARSSSRPVRPTARKDEVHDGGQKPMNSGQVLQRQIVTAARALDALVQPDAKVELSSVNARVRHGEETLHLGPGELRMRREQERVIVELSPGGTKGTSVPPEGEQALTFRLSVPLGVRAETEGDIEADVHGGPIWLSTLGVRDGDFGLFDVGATSIRTRSHIVLTRGGRELRIDGEGKVQNLSLRSAALSDVPVAGIDLSWRAKAKAALDGSRVDVADGEVDLGSIHLSARGQYENVGGAHRVQAEIDVPLAGCQAMLDSVPKGLAPKLQGMRLAGSFALRGKARFDTARLDRDFQLDWDASSSCRVTEVPPELHVARFRKPFLRTAYDPSGKRVDVESGPGSSTWVPLGGISPFMEVAVLTTEDGGFPRHHGFDRQAIKNSIRENLRKRKFVRGASTISMQLAKNLYLDRTKNLSRKLQEAMLTMYLEQELTKEQLMELYLNVVEFGPMIYGIGPAARHYFNTSPSALSLGQALYISSIMPNPKVQHFAAGGVVTPGWTGYLRKLMHLAHGHKRISDDELEEGLSEIVVRGSPAPQRDPDGESGPPAEEPAGDEVEPAMD